MTSINTNIAAQTALRTLQSTNAQLDQTQSRISTGLKIAEAKDNAAYWSISTTLKSDNKALGTVKDALALGAATVDTAYQGLNETLAVLDEITAKLTAATNGNVDRAAVQREISELQNQLRGIANASTFSGENWLSVDAVPADDKTIVSGFTRAANGTVTLANISIDTSNFVLLTTAETGLLNGVAGNAATSTAGTQAIAGMLLTTGGGDGVTFGSTAQTVGPRDVIAFSITPTSGSATRVEIDQRLINATLNVTDGQIRTGTEFRTVLLAALQEAGLGGVSVTLGATDDVEMAIGGGTITTAGAASTRAGVLGISISANTSADDMRAAINTVSAAAASVKASATTLGAVAKRIELQQSFVSNLMDTIDAGVSGLVDADMNEESTRLQALQVKQQLGVQALSIANQSAQNVLRLFQ